MAEKRSIREKLKSERGFWQSGLKYDYPRCCTRQFAHRIVRKIKIPLKNKFISQGTGFIFCDYHTKQCYIEYINSNKSWKEHCDNYIKKHLGRHL